MRTITICTDAGHVNIHHQSVAVWASYMRTPSQTIHTSGIIGQPCKGSSHAELYAIANALHVISRNYDLTKYRLILYADNLYALRNHIDGTLGKKTNKKSIEHREVYDKYIRTHLDKAGSFEARHVKAHLPESQWGKNRTRFYMQDWCDREVHRLVKIGKQLVMDKINKK